MNDIKKFFDQTIKKSQRTYNNMWEITTAQGDG